MRKLSKRLLRPRRLAGPRNDGRLHLAPLREGCVRLRAAGSLLIDG